MNAFATHYAQLSTDQRRKVRRDLEAEAARAIMPRIGLFSTNAQIKASARKMVDMAIAAGRRAQGPQRDDL